MTAHRFYPDFLHEFACKKGNCRNTCCRDWEIRLSKGEFQASTSYRFGPECYALANKNLHRNPGNSDDADYAFCTLKPDGFCSFLTSERLCAWKVQTGMSLCAACDDFPRSFIAHSKNEYIFPAMSCEAMLELLLNRTEPIRLASEPIEQHRDRYYARIEEDDFRRRPLLKLYPELTQWALTILQDRRFNLDDRMVLLAHAMCLIDWMERNRRVGELTRSMENFLATENLQQILHQHSGLPIGPKALLAVTGHSLLAFVDHSRFKTKCRRILAGLGIELVEKEENGQIDWRLSLIDTEIYLKRKEALSDFMLRQQTFLEHVLVCEYLRSMVPVTEPNVWESFSFFNVCYALLKGAFAGMFESPPGDEEMVDTIAVGHRMFVHNYATKAESLARLKAMQLTDLRSMVALAKG